MRELQLIFFFFQLKGGLVFCKNVIKRNTLSRQAGCVGRNKVAKKERCYLRGFGTVARWSSILPDCSLIIREKKSSSGTVEPGWSPSELGKLLR